MKKTRYQVFRHRQGKYKTKIIRNYNNLILYMKPQIKLVLACLSLFSFKGSRLKNLQKKNLTESSEAIVIKKNYKMYPIHPSIIADAVCVYMRKQTLVNNNKKK